MKVLACLLLVLTALQQPTADLVARWDSEARPGEGLSTWMEFSADGSCTRTSGLMIDGTWTLDGDTLTVTTGTASDPFVLVTSVSFSADVLTQTANGVRRTRARLQGPEAGMPPLVGVWSYQYPSGGTAYDEYTSDGRFLFRLAASTASCRWTVDSDRLTLVEGRLTQTMSWRLAADRLTLRPGADEESFRRERHLLIGARLPR